MMNSVVVKRRSDSDVAFIYALPVPAAAPHSHVENLWRCVTVSANFFEPLKMSIVTQLIANSLFNIAPCFYTNISYN